MIHQELWPVLDLEVAENVFLGREIRRMGCGTFGVVDLGRMRQRVPGAFRPLFH